MFESSWLPRLSTVCRFLLFFFSLAISLTVSFVSSFPFSSLAVSGLAYVSCHFASSCDAVPGSCIVYFSCCFASSLDTIAGSPAAYFSCHFKSSCVAIAGYCQLCSMMQSSLLWFLRGFLGTFLCYLFLIAYNEDMTVWKSEREIYGLCSCCQKQNAEDSELTLTELNAPVVSKHDKF